MAKQSDTTPANMIFALCLPHAHGRSSIHVGIVIIVELPSIVEWISL